LSHLSDTQKRAYIIADNKLALNSGWDEELLKLELIELAALGFDVDLIGFDDAELNVFLSNEENDNADYSDKNKEIDVDALEEMMELKFKLTFDEYQEAKERLSEISSTPENALKLLLKMEI
jgi:ParB-like chromosome segregation protein Spo0J